MSARERRHSQRCNGPAIPGASRAVWDARTRSDRVSRRTEATSGGARAMTVPVTGNIQFMPPGGVFLTVDSISDPGGGPADVLDVDQGFTVKGTVVLPNWLAGTGTVT